jgi:tRNA pseudouridine32 synthase/23S rRNA pseudouridine746 synthase
LRNSTLIIDPFFTAFEEPIAIDSVPNKFTLMRGNEPHVLCKLAASKLQVYLKNQSEWNHNFGFKNEKQGRIIGKMFGVLVVKTQQNKIGYLSAFSGKLAGGNHHAKFVPPVFDLLTNNSFLNTGMIELSRINKEIRQLNENKPLNFEEQIKALKVLRKSNSIALQQQIFENYEFINEAGNEKNISTLFKKSSYKNPPAGAGECAAPKLLQYAFKHHMKPLSLAEFWWGLSPKSTFWEHGKFYACCKEKCEPILVHMLAETDYEIK